MSEITLKPRPKCFGGYTAKSCVEQVRKDVSSAYADAPRDPISEVLQRRFDSGNAFEDDIIGMILELHKDDPGVVVLDGVSDRENMKAMRQWREDSMKALKDPDVWFVVNARLEPLYDERRTGEPDFLIRLANGDWAPVDAKDHKEMYGSSAEKPYRISTLASPRYEDGYEDLMLGLPQQKDSMQLAHYRRMLIGHGLASEETTLGAIIGRTGNFVWRDMADKNVSVPGVGTPNVSILEKYEAEWQVRMDVVEVEERRNAGENLQPAAKPILHDDCSTCHWRTVCKDEMGDMDSPSLLAGGTVAAVNKIAGAGVTTTRQLARLDHNTAKLVEQGLPLTAIIADADGLDPATPLSEFVTGRGAKSRIAKLEASGVTTAGDVALLDPVTARIPKMSGLARLIDQARVAKAGKVYLARGVDYVNFPRSNFEIDIDFEDSDGYTYMLGMLRSGRKIDSRTGDRINRSEYRAFCAWDGTEGAEAEAWGEFWRELMAWHEYSRANRYGFRVYFYTSHETHAVQKLAAKYEHLENCPSLKSVMEFIQSDRWIDLYPIVKNDMVWPTPRYTVKDLAKWVRHVWSGEGVDGELSIIWYKQIMDPETDPEVREGLIQQLLTYNKEDCEATLKIRDWITALSDSQRRPGEKLPNVAALDARFKRR